jgi:hypothetical protein
MVKKVLPGIEIRKFMESSSIINDNKCDSNYVLIDGIRYTCPSDLELCKKGKLQNINK